jgi:hypothetical protein
VIRSGNILDNSYSYTNNNSYIEKDGELVPVEFVPKKSTKQPGLDSL